LIAKVLRVEIIARKDDFWPVLEAVKRSGTLHIEPVEDESEALGLSEEEASEERALSSLLPLFKEMASRGFPESEPLDLGTDGVVRETREIYGKFKSELGRLEEMRSSLRLIADHARVLAAAARVVREGQDHLIITISREELRHLNRIKGFLAERGVEPKLEAVEVAGSRVAVVIPGGNILAELREFLYKEGFNELRLPDSLSGLSPREAIARLEQDLKELPLEIKKAEEGLAAYLSERAQRLSALMATALDRLACLRVKAKMAKGGRFTFALSGWVLEEERDSLLKALKGLRAAVRFSKPDRKEYHRVPVKLKNPPFARPFEALLAIYQLPMYGTSDPTWALWFFFPIYFGFMLGDIGYGIIALVIFGFMRALSRPRTMLRDFANLFLWASGWTIAFGIAYGEFFGSLGEALGMRPLLFHRLHDITPMLLVAVGLGVLQVLLGIFMGFLNNIKLRHYKHAIYELARFLGIGGIIVAVLGLAKVLPNPGLWVGLALILVSLPAVVWVEGFIAPLEMLSAIGNMMSFARLMAIGMASAILAMIANIFYSKIPLLIGGLIVALLFHTLNTVLGIFDPTIQGLRLQFVEFFSKFYVTGTKAFKPLRIGGKDYVS